MICDTFNPQDLEMLITLYQHCFAEAPWYERFERDDIKNMVEQIVYEWPEGIVLIAREVQEGPIIGAAMGFHLCRKEDVFSRTPPSRQNAFYIAELFVNRTFRKRGICKHMAQQLFLHYRAHGYTHAVVRTSVDQPAIQKLFGHRGDASHEFILLGFQQVLSTKIIDGTQRILPDRRVILGGSIEGFLTRTSSQTKKAC
jgi:GNAT superfamily N-acetyltransferase